MTQTRYLLWRIAQTFGISMHQRHAGHAAAETHLLREAEEILGRLTWADAENLEDLSVEYWSLRRMVTKHETILGNIESANVSLQKSHDHRAELLSMVVDSTKDLVEERTALEQTNERLNSEHKMIVSDARAIRRRHDGIKAKLEVLVGEGGPHSPELDASKQELLGLKKQFNTLRDRRDTVVDELKSVEHALNNIETRIETRRSEVRDEALGSYQNLGKVNRDLSSNRVELGSLEGQMNTLFSEIGRYVLAHHREPPVTKVASAHYSLINQMSALDLSIKLNRRLSGERYETAP